MSIADILASLAQADAELKAKNENYEQALLDATEQGRRERDQEVADMQSSRDALQVEFDGFKVQAEIDRLGFGESEYTRGMADGVASVPPCPEIPPVEIPPVDRTEIDAALLKIAELEASVLAMQGRITELETIVVGKDQEMVDFKSRLKAKYAESQATETASEVDFQAFLDS